MFEAVAVGATVPLGSGDHLRCEEDDTGRGEGSPALCRPFVPAGLPESRRVAAA
jgi:hypothetical protein